jgi:type IV secretory pathway TrbD component
VSELKTSTVHRRLDAKIKVGGAEASDLILVLLLAAVLNLFLGQVPFGAVFIFGIPALVFAGLYFGKRGKPEGFLLHWAKFHLTPGELWAGELEDN